VHIGTNWITNTQALHCRMRAFLSRRRRFVPSPIRDNGAVDPFDRSIALTRVVFV
jgi:hypothetical protein